MFPDKNIPPNLRRELPLRSRPLASASLIESAINLNSKTTGETASVAPKKAAHIIIYGSERSFARRRRSS